MDKTDRATLLKSKYDEVWREQISHIFRMRELANFKRRHNGSPDRNTTLIELQKSYKPRDGDTLRSFY